MYLWELKTSASLWNPRTWGVWNLSEETYAHQKRFSKQTTKRDLQSITTQVSCLRYVEDVKKDLPTSKETYTHQKRPTHIKRDLHTSKETYPHQKRPTHIKRDLHTSKETYTHQTRLPKQTKERDLQSTATELLCLGCAIDCKSFSFVCFVAVDCRSFSFVCFVDRGCRAVDKGKRPRALDKGNRPRALL